MDDAARLERQRALKQANNRRYQDNLRARRICTTILVGEDALQGLVWSGLLPEHLSSLKAEIQRSAQAAFDQWVQDQLHKVGF